MKTVTFDIYNDPGHGWLKTTRAKLQQLGIAELISTYSYQRGDSVFLEEDCDAGILVSRLRHLGYTVKFREHHADKRSRIRGYECYRPRLSAPTP